MKSLTVIVFLFFALVSYSSECTIKTYLHKAVPAMEETCDQDPWGNEDPWCGFSEDKYAITWISFLKPVSKEVIKDKSLQSCIMTAFMKHKGMIDNADEMIWGHKVSYNYKSKSEKSKNKFVWRNPNYIERK